MNKKTLSTRIEEIEKEQAGLINARCHMYKVHEELRNVNRKAYQPVLLAIGPYNDQDNICRGFMEEHKLLYLQQMLKRTKGSLETYIKAMKELEKETRKCYVERISHTPDEFVEMMLLDGCFIIELFHKYEIYRNRKDEDEQSSDYEAHDPTDESEPIISNKQSSEYEAQDPIDEGDPIISSKEDDPIEEVDPIFQMTWVLPKIARDLLLFENQLPFFVLEELFEMMSKSNETTLPRNRSRNSGEHIVDIEEKDGSSVESSTSTHQIILTPLNVLALRFFNAFLPYRWNVDTSSYNSIEKIERLLCLTHKALDPLLPEMVWERLGVGFRFKNAEFEHLLGLIHASICISILDLEINHVAERQEAGVKLKKVEIFKHLFGPIRKAVITLLAKMENMRKAISYSKEFQRSVFQVNMAEKWKHLHHGLNKIENWKSIPFGSEIRDVGVEFYIAKKFKDKLDENDRWNEMPFATELQEAGIELNKAKEFKVLYYQSKDEDQKPKLCETRPEMDGVKLKMVEKFKSLLCPSMIENWKSIPYGKELHKAKVEYNKAKKFKRLHALREIEHWNIHGATELEEAGIEFKKANKCNGFSIKFNNGIMEISPLIIEDDTETFLRNLVAYEQYCDQNKGFVYVNNYVCFMDDLINSPKDVELLRRRGIIQNYLGDDEVISNMINKLGDNITISARRSIYARTSIDVNWHCKRRKNVWMAILRRDYFNTPWALISFLAAIFLLGLAITQTIFSIIQ